jgi:hypothetical protein
MGYTKGNVSVAFLQEGIDAKVLVCVEGTPMRSTSDIRKVRFCNCNNR